MKILSTEDQSYTIFSDQFSTSYHSLHGAIQESMHVYIQAGMYGYQKFFGLPKELRIFEMGFGTGLNACLSLMESNTLGCKIMYHTIEKYPLSRELADAYTRMYDGQQLEEKLQILHALSWDIPQALTSNFEITKIACDFFDFNAQHEYDVIYFDAFGPSTQPDLWGEKAVSKMYDLLADQGILTTFCAQGQFKRLLKAQGFTVHSLPGPKGKREITQAVKG